VRCRPSRRPRAGALIVGLYGEDGTLREIGHSSGFTAREKRELPARPTRYETGERGSGEPSRWEARRDLEWIALRAELVGAKAEAPTASRWTRLD
jgi:hypothetical protein